MVHTAHNYSESVCIKLRMAMLSTELHITTHSKLGLLLHVNHGNVCIQWNLITITVAKYLVMEETAV